MIYLLYIYYYYYCCLAIKEDSVSRPEKIKKQIPGVLTEESKKSKTQLETDNDFLGDESDVSINY